MTEIDTYITDSKKLTQIFGVWPSFHDAEILELQLSRGSVVPNKGEYIFPVITAKIHLWQMTKEVDSKGCFVRKNHTVVTIRFEGVDEVELNGFNHQNAIFGLAIDRLGFVNESESFNVRFEPAYGLNGTFKCSRIEVVNALPCMEN